MPDNRLLLLCLCLLIIAPANAQVIDYSTFVRIAKNGERVIERSFLIQVNNREQQWLADISIPYGNGEKVDILDAYILNSRGMTVRRLKNKEVTTRSDISDGSFFEDDYVKEFSLNWHEYPYQVRYSYRVTSDEFLYVIRWFPAVYEQLTTVRASLSIELPSGYQVFTDYSGEFHYSNRQTDGNEIHQWELRNFRLPERELFAPHLWDQMPQVMVVPEHFRYVIPGSFSSWGSYGAWHQALNKGLDVLPASERSKVETLVAGINDKRELVKMLYHYMQDNTRYINVAIDAGGLKPYPASYVSEKKYGDCKALTVYMKALLKCFGIPSYYTIIHAGSNYPGIKRRLPAQQFNHVILSVPLDGDTLWLENTARHFPYNYLGTFTQNRYALLVDGNNSRLVRTPSLGLDDVLEQNKYIFRLGEEGNGSMYVHKKLKGEAFEEYRYYHHEMSARDQQKKVVEDLKIVGFEPGTWSLQLSERDIPEIGVEAEGTVSEHFRRIGSLMVIHPVSVDIPDLEPPEKRENPVQIKYPTNKIDTIVYELPFISQYKVELPQKVAVETAYGSYTENYIRSHHRIMVVKRFELLSGHYSKDVYSDFYSFIEAIRSKQKQSVILLTKNK